jgi:hypothetical protein
MFKEYDELDLWPSCFTGIQVIVNRTTPPHRDKGGSPTLYNMLVSAGTHTGSRMKCRELGLELAYDPGAIVIVCGKVLLHKVKLWAKGERICVAHMMKDNVHDKQDVAWPAWPVLSYYLSMIGIGDT